MTGLFNRAMRTLYLPSYRQFRKPRSIRAVQMQLLGDMLFRNENTVYGRKFSFAKIHNYRQFAENVPLTEYEDYAPYIDRICHGRKGILTAEPVILLEPTSGSSGGRKLIPYTKTLKAQFQAGIRPWLCDLYTNLPALCDGKSYWSVTPVTHGKEFSPGGIPIGFEEDTAYFGKLEGRLMQEIMAVSSNVKFVGSMELFWHSTAVQLLTCGKLRLISVWNPSFLTLLCDYIRGHADMLERTLSRTVAPQRLEAARDKRFDKVFPELQLISCWADGSAADLIPDLRKRFPGVPIQPKGLLATECFTSFPLLGEIGARLCIDAHFFEFRRLSDGKIFTADRLTKGEYELIVTTGGGFYRYCIGDVVEILETYPDAPPRLRFLRRKGIRTDLCGEKLTEEFVRSVCRKLCGGAFCLLAPEGLGYTLYTTADIDAKRLDAALCESYHYQYCRDLGQLRRAEVVRVTGEPQKAYLARLTADGMRLGDIKPAFLSKKSGWEKFFSIRK